MGLEKKIFSDQGREDEEQATQKRTKRDAAKVKKAASKAALASPLKVILDPAILKQKPPKVKDIDLQLEWHRGFDDQVPKKSHLIWRTKQASWRP